MVWFQVLYCLRCSVDQFEVLCRRLRCLVGQFEVLCRPLRRLVGPDFTAVRTVGLTSHHRLILVVLVTNFTS